MLLRRLGLACAVLVVLGLPAGASADGGCPNEAVRREQGSTGLPDCRAYELVSPAEKNGSFFQGGDVAVSPAGGRALFSPTSGPSGGGLLSYLLGTRGASGWESHSVLPASPDRPNPLYDFAGVTSDLTKYVANVYQGMLHPSLGTIARIDEFGGEDTLFGPGQVQQMVAFISDDGSRVLAQLKDSFDPGHLPDTRHVYDLGSQPPVLVSRMPDGSVPTCGTAFISLIPLKAQQWLSSDGSRLFFRSKGNDCGSEPELYVRDLVADTTTLVSGPPVAGASQGAMFLRASTDGSEAAYLSAARISATDTNEGLDVYLWRVGVGSTCLTCVVPDAGVELFSVAVSEDLSHVYFTSHSQLVPGKGAAGSSNLYVLHAGTIDYVSPADRVSHYPTGSEGGPHGEVTPDGRVLLFESSQSGLDSLSGSENSGLSQFYRYDERDGSVTCVSCPRGHAAASEGGGLSHGGFGYYERAMSDDGSRVFFGTPEALVPGDVNDGGDIYEWHDGVVGLITDGVSRHLPQFGDQLMGTTASGEDVFFVSYARLTPDVVDGSNQLYDARVGGGFPAPAVPAACDGDACQGQPAGVPVFGAVGSGAVFGAGNLTPPVSGAAGKTTVRKKAAKRKPLKRKAKKHRRKGRGAHKGNVGVSTRGGRGK